MQSCSECSEPMLAQSLCTLCNKWLCYQCTDVHQHQRPPVTSQYSDLHPQQRTSSIQCSDLHQKGSGSLPPNGQGMKCASLLAERLFFFFIFPAVLHLFVSHFSVRTVAMNNAWDWRWLITVPGYPCALLHLSLTHGPDSKALK